MNLPTQASETLWLSESVDDVGLPGVLVVFEPEEAEAWGAFIEDALSLSEAIEAHSEENLETWLAFESATAFLSELKTEGESHE